jgi:hypothetical protein
MYASGKGRQKQIELQRLVEITLDNLRKEQFLHHAHLDLTLSRGDPNGIWFQIAKDYHDQEEPATYAQAKTVETWYLKDTQGFKKKIDSMRRSLETHSKVETQIQNNQKISSKKELPKNELIDCYLKKNQTKQTRLEMILDFDDFLFIQNECISGNEDRLRLNYKFDNLVSERLQKLGTICQIYDFNFFIVILI